MNSQKFKIGDKVHCGDINQPITITGMRDDGYLTDSAYGVILFSDQDNWGFVDEDINDELEMASRRILLNNGSIIYNLHKEDAINSYIKESFKSGAKWMKEQMLKDAIECNVDWYDGPLLDYTQEQQDDALDKIGANVGDKVKVILIKQ